MVNDWLLHYLWAPGWAPFLITWPPHLFTQASAHGEFFTFNCWKNGPKWSLPQSFPGLKFSIFPRPLQSQRCSSMPPTPDHHTGARLPGTHVVLAPCPLELEQKPIRGGWRQPAAVCCLAHWGFLVYLNCGSVHLKICWFARNPDFWNFLKLVNLATLEQDWGLGSNCPFWVPHSSPSQPGPLPSPFRNWIGTPQILLLLLFYKKGNWGIEKAKWFPQYHTTSKWQAEIAFKVCFAPNWCF